MRRTNFNLIKDTASWPQAVRLLESFLVHHEKVDTLWQQLPNHATAGERRSCRGRVLAALRYGHLVNQLIDHSARRPPKNRLRALLLVAGGEWLSSGLAGPDASQLALTANHAVETAKNYLSTGEARFVNALLRRWPEILQKHFPSIEERLLATCPPDLRKRWQKQFDPSALQQLLSWNLSESPNWLYYPAGKPDSLPSTLPQSPWTDYYQLPAGPIDPEATSLLAQADAYIKDPGTRFAVEWLSPKAGDSVLDLCAAPGGKSFQIAHALGFQGQLIAIDVPGKRHERLCENLSRLERQGFQPRAIAADLIQLQPQTLTSQYQLPGRYPKVVIDVPCSNSGVLRRRPDASWRLNESVIQAVLPLQRDLLAAAARFVAPNGTLIYSTCSIENEENHTLVEAFLQSTEGTGFTLEKGYIHYPWQTGHDGGGVFKLKRTGSKSNLPRAS
jgi:16S rRNA (cytosine967-C5)-methyltransferase